MEPLLCLYSNDVFQQLSEVSHNLIRASFPLTRSRCVNKEVHVGKVVDLHVSRGEIKHTTDQAGWEYAPHRHIANIFQVSWNSLNYRFRQLYLP